MIVQLVLGSALMAISAVAAGLSWWGLEAVLIRANAWVTRPPHGPRLVIVLCIALFWVLLLMTVSVWIWALALWGLGIFPALEPSVYFALVAFTTLGFGDVLLPQDWRLLSGMSAANGLLIFGIMTAMLVETLRETRLRQRQK